MFGRPGRFLRSSVWGRSFAYLALSVPLGLAWLVALAATFRAGYSLPEPAVSVLTVYAEAGLWPFDPFQFERWARYSDLVIMGTWAIIAVALFSAVVRPAKTTSRWRRGRRWALLSVGVAAEVTLPLVTFDDPLSVMVGLPMAIGYITLLLLAVAPVVGSLAAELERRQLRWRGVSSTAGRAREGSPEGRGVGQRRDDSSPRHCEDHYGSTGHAQNGPSGRVRDGSRGRARDGSRGRARDGSRGRARDGRDLGARVRRRIRWLVTRWRDPLAWRDLGGIVVIGVVDAVIIVLPAAFLLGRVGSVPSTTEVPYYGWLVLPVAAFVTPYAATSWAALRVTLVHASLVRMPLRSPRRRSVLDRQLVEVTASRARILDAFETERRRIERDLHDGAQQRLTGLIMTLGLVRLDLDDAHPRVRDLVDRAQDEARSALGELRDLVRGIYPQVLADRGLGAAVEGLAERCAVPVTVDIKVADRLPEPVESAAYFTVAEALANVAKHSGASRAEVSARVIDGELVIEIQDDGAGGAEPVDGGGLVGLADRVAVHRGALRLSSPPGGPSVLRVEIPVAVERAT